MNLIDLRFTTVKSALPKFIYSGIEDYANKSNNYYHQPNQLVKKIAELHSVEESMVYITAGADQALFC